MQRIQIFILLFKSLRVLSSARDYYIVLERLETLKGDEVPLVEYALRLTRPGHGDDRYILNGYMIYREDLGLDVQHMVRTSYSATGTSLFRTHPYAIQKSNICHFFKTFYRQYGQPWIHNHTDFPLIPEGGLCPLPKGKFYVRNLTYEELELPTHAPRGSWLFEQRFERKGKLIGGMVMYAKITDKV